MSWTVSPQLKSVDGVPIGTAYGGGYVAGFISHTANGVPTHALIVAPAATGATGTGYTLTTNLAWKTSDTNTSGTASSFDGAANTSAMVTAGITNHPAAQFCTSLNIGGLADWYLPSRLELDIAYFNLKPTTASNITSSGTNAYAVPQRNSNWSASYPAQTGLSLFTGAQSFVANKHWSSTQVNAGVAWDVDFANGDQGNLGFYNQKTLALQVRAFRRIAL